MARTSTTGISRGEPALPSLPDKGCRYYPVRCTSCPWRECLLTLPSAEQLRITTALRTLKPYLPAPDRVIDA